MRKLFLGLVGIFLSSHCLFSQIDNVGAGHAINFDGIDDYIDVGNIYDDLSLPFTISAWVYIDPTSNFPGPVFVSQDNDPIYNGFWFFATPAGVFIEYGDGRGENLPAYRRGKTASVSNMMGRWNHVCAVMKGPSDVDLYVNGFNVGGAISGDSDLPMASVFPNDVAKIGYFLSNGVTYRFKGIIDEVRMWNRALSETEIRQTMCKKLKGDEPGLIGYWTFDETMGDVVTDKSVNNFNGQLKGNPSRVFSGAPLGDESVFTYTGAWTNKTLSITDGDDQLTVSNIRGSPYGIHLYSVRSIPSQTNGLDLSTYNQPYIGAFIASGDIDNLFDATYYFEENEACKIFSRADNSVPTWGITALPLKDKLQRAEFVKVPGGEIGVDLGADRIICGQTSHALQTGIADTQVSLKWNTGQTSSEIMISQTGSYWVTATMGCNSSTDTVHVIFEQFLEDISLGEDEDLCVINSRLLNPISNPTGLDFTWQDGSKLPTYEVTNFGTYWLIAKNVCGEVKDTVTFSKIDSKDINLDLGADRIICGQTSHSLQTGITNPAVSFEWSTGQTTHEITINQTGSYWVKASLLCNSSSDTIHVIIEKFLKDISLGADEDLCVINPRSLNPISNPIGLDFTWHDGSKQPTFDVVDFGTFWLTVKNVCGEVKDTVTFSRIDYKDEVIPNVFTPNGDQHNEFFLVSDKIKGLVSLEVFNRWGTLIYSSSTYNNDWDGTDVASGIYFYRILGACVGEKKGSLSILK